jgi:hypothetical protein
MIQKLKEVFERFRQARLRIHRQNVTGLLIASDSWGMSLAPAASKSISQNSLSSGIFQSRRTRNKYVLSTV